MEGITVLVPLTRVEYNNVIRYGRIIEKRCNIKGNDFCIIISDHFVGSSETINLVQKGFNVLPLDISGISWWDIDRKGNHTIAEYENQIFLCVISQNMYHQLLNDMEENKKERKGENSEG
jgi:hypothetical protein